MRPSSGTIIIVVIVCAAVLGGLFYWQTTGYPSPLCGGCYRYNAPSCPVNPCRGREGLSLDSSQLNSPTNITMNIRNSGVMGVSFVSYTVQYYSNQYSKTNWTTFSVQPYQVAAFNIIIDGSTFTFQSKNTYTIALTTTRNNIFTFTVTA